MNVQSTEIKLSDKEFELFKKFIHKISGIQMKPEKKVLVESRLAKRLRYYQFRTYRDYYEYLQTDDVEQQMFIDIITTNETSFFREPHHFEYLKTAILPQHKGPIRIWSAACSIGAEAYSSAMVCDEVLEPVMEVMRLSVQISMQMLLKQLKLGFILRNLFLKFLKNI